MEPEISPSPAFSFDPAVSGIGAEILDKMPDVQEHAVAAHEAKTAEEDANVERDSEGVAFDPQLHTGSKLKDGKWRKRKNAGTPGSVVATSRKRSASSGVVDAAPAADPNAEAVATGTVIATLFLGACQSVGGDEWEPTDHERAFQTSAWQAYCVSKNMKELSPGLALSVALGSYAGPRLAKPKTAAKISRARTWVTLRVARWKIKRELQRRGITAEVEIVDGDIYVNGKPKAEADELR